MASQFAPGELANRFGYHPATSDTGPMHDAVRKEFLELADWLDAQLPDGRTKALAMTSLEEAMHWSNAAIALTAPLARQA